MQRADVVFHRHDCFPGDAFWRHERYGPMVSSAHTALHITCRGQPRLTHICPGVRVKRQSTRLSAPEQLNMWIRGILQSRSDVGTAFSTQRRVILTYTSALIRERLLLLTSSFLSWKPSGSTMWRCTINAPRKMEFDSSDFPRLPHHCWANHRSFRVLRLCNGNTITTPGQAGDDFLFAARSQGRRNIKSLFYETPWASLLRRDTDLRRHSI